VENWTWLRHYLQVDLNLAEVLATFPQDAAMQNAVHACRGLRLLRQDPWECLASFILSSTKQIIQIRQIISLLCGRFGGPICDGEGLKITHAFPTAQAIAELNESELRGCKMGFRAPYLLETARAIAGGGFDPATLGKMPSEQARRRLTELPGVGPKIADCVLLFAYGFQDAFPVDVWVMKALRELYFPRRNPGKKQIQKFVNSHFGRHAGFAQQYLFHYMRTRKLQLPTEKTFEKTGAELTRYR
jgi:N-glycosylase/DNA lyase